MKINHAIKPLGDYLWKPDPEPRTVECACGRFSATEDSYQVALLKVIKHVDEMNARERQVASMLMFSSAVIDPKALIRITSV